jgi:hypothetical protein
MVLPITLHVLKLEQSQSQMKPPLWLRSNHIMEFYYLA